MIYTQISDPQVCHVPAGVEVNQCDRNRVWWDGPGKVRQPRDSTGRRVASLLEMSNRTREQKNVRQDTCSRQEVETRPTKF